MNIYRQNPEDQGKELEVQQGTKKPPRTEVVSSWGGDVGRNGSIIYSRIEECFTWH